MASKSLLCFFLILSSFLHLGSTDPGSELLAQGLRDAAVAAAKNRVQCMARLIPCQPFLKSPTNPSKACCMPLQEMATNETDCLCYLFNNTQILKALQVTQEEALKLPAACEIDVDVKKCNLNARPIATPAASPVATRAARPVATPTVSPAASPAATPSANRAASPVATPPTSPAASPVASLAVIPAPVANAPATEGSTSPTDSTSPTSSTSKSTPFRITGGFTALLIALVLSANQA